MAYPGVSLIGRYRVGGSGNQLRELSWEWQPAVRTAPEWEWQPAVRAVPEWEWQPAVRAVL